VRLVAGHVEHLTALQQLTLDGVEVYAADASSMVQSLGALQQLRLFSPVSSQQQGLLVQLAAKLTACWYLAAQGPQLLPQLDHLTLLQLSWRRVSFLSTDMPAGMAEALAALTGL
jgi:hypothetical protein